MLIAVDLDGTLLNEKKKVGSEEKKWIVNYLNTGNSFAVITTRNYDDSWPIVKEFFEDKKANIFLAYDEGRHIIGKNNYYAQTPVLTTRMVNDIVKVSGKATGYTCYSDVNSIDFLKSHIKVVMLKGYHFFKGDRCKVKFMSNLKNIESSFWKVRINYSEGIEIYEEYLRIKKLLNNYCVTLNEGKIEIMNYKAGKLGALVAICSRCNTNLNEVIYIGDEGNDIYCMMNTISYAMGNAPEWVKNIAKQCTLTNREHGVLKIFNSLKIV